MRYVLLAMLSACMPLAAFAAEKGRETGLPTPRFVSLKSNEINMRKGPGTRYPIEWVYRRARLPVEVMEEFGHWRRVQDVDGSSGWLHKNMLSGARTIITNENDVTYVMEQPAEDASRVAKLELGVIATLQACELEWCRIKLGEVEGWLEKSTFYGAYAKELYNP